MVRHRAARPLGDRAPKSVNAGLAAPTTCTPYLRTFYRDTSRPPAGTTWRFPLMGACRMRSGIFQGPRKS